MRGRGVQNYLKLHQRPYLERLVSKFNNLAGKTSTLPLDAHFSKEQCLVSSEDNVKMEGL